MAINGYFINIIRGYYKLNYHRLLMAIGVILLMVISGYSINGY